MKSIKDLNKKEKMYVWLLLFVMFVMLISFLNSIKNEDNTITHISCANGMEYEYKGIPTQIYINDICNDNNFKIILKDETKRP